MCLHHPRPQKPRLPPQVSRWGPDTGQSTCYITISTHLTLTSSSPHLPYPLPSKHTHIPPHPLTSTLPLPSTPTHPLTGIIHKTNTRRGWRRVCKDGQTNTLPSKQHTPSEESPHLQSLWQRLFIFRVLWRPQFPQ